MLHRTRHIETNLPFRESEGKTKNVALCFTGQDSLKLRMDKPLKDELQRMLLYASQNKTH